MSEPTPLGRKAASIEVAARKLIEALDRMHQRGLLSLNAREARDELRLLVYQPSEGDQ